MTILVIFWSALGLIGYAYAGYPLLLFVRSRIRRRPVRSEPITPRVTLLVVAHNEAPEMGAKLANIEALDYPGAALDVIIASDGSDDGTNERVARHVRPGLRLLALPRRGKIPTLNEAVKRATGDILVFSDANSMYTPDALRALVAPFADPTVGAVAGNQCYVRDGGGSMASLGERLYWSYDRTLKRLQSASGSVIAATGAIHAIRRELFRPVPTGVSDDFMTSTRAIAAGYRLAFAPDAIAYETVAPTERAEFARKLRIIVRGLRGLWVARSLFDPVRHGFYAVQLFSHKLLRWSICWLLLVLLGTSLVLYDDGFVYRALAQAQIAFYGCAAAGWTLRGTRLSRTRVFRVFGMPLYFSLANLAALRAWLQVAGGVRVDAWSSARAPGRTQGVASLESEGGAPAGAAAPLRL